MLNLFRKNVFARKRRAKVMPLDITSRIETLESRIVPADVNVVFNTINGSLTINGSGDVDDVIVNFNGPNQIVLSGGGATNFVVNGAAPVGTTGTFLVTGKVSINLGNGNDILRFNGNNPGGTLTASTVDIDLGSGSDTVSSTGVNAIVFAGDVSILGGSGDDSITLGSAAASVTIDTLAIDTEAGDAGTSTINLQNVVVNGSTKLANGAKTGGTASVILGNANPNDFNGSLSIAQGNGAATYNVTIGNGAFVNDVSGDLVITNGGTAGGAATVAVRRLNVGGLTTVNNGANATNSVTLAGDGAGDAATTALAGRIEVTNGAATTSNAITIRGLLSSGADGIVLTNGVSPNNDILLGDTSTNTFAANLTAKNNSAAGGANDIVVGQGTFNGNTTLSNDTGLGVNAVTAGANTITLGNSVGTSTSVVGNLSLTNGDATTANNVNIDRLSVSGVKAGDLEINNGSVSAGSTSVVFGAAAAANTVGGSLFISNQTSGTRTITLDDLDVNGRGGVYIYNVGVGTNDYNFGNTAAGTDLFVLGTLKIEDGVGSATVDVDEVNVGSLVYTDFGGGVDVVNIAAITNSNATIRGITRIDTGEGSDQVNVGLVATATATFGDFVYIGLGAATDTLTIGAGANSAAFNNGDYLIDGGSGDLDVASINSLSVTDYELVSSTELTKATRQKIRNFETYIQT